MKRLGQIIGFGMMIAGVIIIVNDGNPAMIALAAAIIALTSLFVWRDNFPASGQD